MACDDFECVCTCSQPIRHKAMQTAFDSLMKNHTWGEPVEPPPGANLIGCGWVDKTKRGKDSSIIKHKARLVNRCNHQQLCIETAPTRDREIRTLTIRQGAHIHALIHRHEMEDCNTVVHPMIEGAELKHFDGRATDSTIREYQSTIGGIMWAAVCTGPDIAILRSDNQDSIQQIKNGASGHDPTKHVETWHHSLTELTERGIIKMHHIGTADMAADIPTTGLGRHEYEAERGRLGWSQRSQTGAHTA